MHSWDKHNHLRDWTADTELKGWWAEWAGAAVVFICFYSMTQLIILQNSSKVVSPCFILSTGPGKWLKCLARGKRKDMLMFHELYGWIFLSASHVCKDKKKKTNIWKHRITMHVQVVPFEIHTQTNTVFIRSTAPTLCRSGDMPEKRWLKKRERGCMTQSAVALTKEITNFYYVGLCSTVSYSLSVVRS